MPGTDPSRSRPLRLTRRGRAVLAVLATILLLALLLGLRACTPDPQERSRPAGTGTGAGGHTTTAPTVPGTPAAISSATPAATTSGGPRVMVRTGTRGDGTWTTAPLTIAPTVPGTRVHRYAVAVEGGTGIDPREVAAQVQGILDDRRGWAGYRGHAFQLVPDRRQAEFTVFLASPPTTDRMCLPLQTMGTWSCRSGDDVILNTDRWLHMTPTYDDLTAYRSYQVNHEVGHFLGKGHEECGRPGTNAPVMMQQSKRLDGCRPNPWPSADGAAG